MLSRSHFKSLCTYTACHNLIKDGDSIAAINKKATAANEKFFNLNPTAQTKQIQRRWDVKESIILFKKKT
ncbi:MAG: hypothetical protein ACI815_000017 [Psychroserpens sp.]|jgi:hypothetical protein